MSGLSSFLGKKVIVTSGPLKGYKFRAEVFENGLYFSEIDCEVIGFEPWEIEERKWWQLWIT